MQDRFLAQKAFEQLCPEGTLTRVGNGHEALDLRRSQMFQSNVMLLDINMPGMNGFKVLKQLKNDPRLSRIPVEMLSTSEAQADVSKAYTLYASSYLVRSASFEGFLKQIETFLKD